MGALEALNRLPGKQRDAVVLRYHQGLSQEEAAGVQGNGVRKHSALLAKARRRLADSGHPVPPLRSGRPKSRTATGDVMDFDDL